MHEGLKLENISKVYQDENGETTAIKEFNYTFKKGTFTSIVGPSGCGKSTLLSIMAGLEKSSNGNIYIDNQKLTGISSSIGYMLQKDYLLEWRSIYKNITFGLEIKNKLTLESKEYIDSLLKKYDLYEFKDKYPAQLSGRYASACCIN